ncbi:hypothetical protein CRG98_014197 [Punica granatum]|uniref:Uncharacterized protein n=1 Tax=Punica granatum TaxID=22663 RepID=A0A2I0KA87_PUNGR|nr:hypothetical protein CRG98_014197 [Punica granatum]
MVNAELMVMVVKIVAIGVECMWRADWAHPSVGGAIVFVTPAVASSSSFLAISQRRRSLSTLVLLSQPGWPRSKEEDVLVGVPASACEGSVGLSYVGGRGSDVPQQLVWARCVGCQRLCGLDPSMSRLQRSFGLSDEWLTNGIEPEPSKVSQVESLSYVDPNFVALGLVRTAWVRPSSQGHVTDTREKKSPLSVYDPRIEGR